MNKMNQLSCFKAHVEANKDFINDLEPKENASFTLQIAHSNWSFDLFDNTGNFVDDNHRELARVLRNILNKEIIHFEQLHEKTKQELINEIASLRI